MAIQLNHKFYPNKVSTKEQTRLSGEKAVIDTVSPNFLELTPFLSVCIPTYNRGHMLPAAIESVITQDFDNFELIICDNASTDNTEEVVKDYTDKRIRYVRYPTLVSMYANHNRCIELARGNWIIFLHSDDRINNLKSAQLILESLPSGVSACFPYRGAKEINLPTYQEWNFLEILQLMNGISPSGSIYQKDALDKQGGFAEDNIIADWEILLNMAWSRGLVYSYSSEPFVTRVVHGKNAYLKSIKDGTAHLGKSHCIKRLFADVSFNDFKKIINLIILQGAASKISLLYFYLLISGLDEKAEWFKKEAINLNKFSLLSAGSVYGILVKIMGRENFWRFYQKIRQIA
ncbi:MAG TPA: glycosyltransferase [Oscillatoriaceae cyanobacterium M33_DOE_052]|uniref:Glycosyltransferase n=1 Tax=Planktothricoides sp. SpSt-374 TaxID=2282167 RepID=A0A7C3ZTC5_9CYAN|nr:glycosyltransferase [Oscillatoriaceae cyanobacterium M33_DOE_052]